MHLKKHDDFQARGVCHCSMKAALGFNVCETFCDCISGFGYGGRREHRTVRYILMIVQLFHYIFSERMPSSFLCGKVLPWRFFLPLVY